MGVTFELAQNTSADSRARRADLSVAWTASGARLAIWWAMDSAWVWSPARGTTSLTRPRASASVGGDSSPVKSQRMARDHEAVEEWSEAKDQRDAAQGQARALAHRAVVEKNSARTKVRMSIEGQIATYLKANLRVTTALPVTCDDSALDDVATVDNWLKLWGKYKVVWNHGEVIGLGYRGDDETKQTVPHPEKTDGTTIDVYPDVEFVEDLKKTFTNFEVKGDPTLAAPGDPSTWTVIQHFPCSMGEATGIAGTN